VAVRGGPGLAAAARIVLPLLALAVLSTLFLFSDRHGGRDPLPWTEAELGELARDMRLGAPRFAGVTADGAALAIAAEAVQPERTSDGAAGTASGLAARWRSRDGLAIDVAAPIGRLDTASGLVELTSGASVTTGTGYRLSTGTLVASLDRTRLESAGEVTGSGPPGELHAGRMLVTAEPGPPARHVLVFKDGVRVIYAPAR
jgi:lipopolysaccharide export system protein LptC